MRDVPVLRHPGHDPAPRASRVDWFADEVALDFPSLAPAAERMCAAFLGGAGNPPVSAEVSLTPSEAAHGRRVPVDVAVPSPCDGCGGRGEVWGESCRRCAGSGDGSAFHLVSVDVPAGVKDGARFLFTIAPAPGASLLVTLCVRVA